MVGNSSFSHAERSFRAKGTRRDCARSRQHAHKKDESDNGPQLSENASLGTFIINALRQTTGCSRFFRSPRACLICLSDTRDSFPTASRASLANFANALI